MTLSHNFNVNSVEWRELREIMRSEREDLVSKLIKSDCPETRGGIKQLDKILALDKAGNGVEMPPDPEY